MSQTDTLFQALRNALDNADIGSFNELTRQLTDLIEDRVANKTVASKPSTRIESLRQSVESYDHARTSAWCNDFCIQLQNSNTPCSVEDANEILTLLRRKRLFSDLRKTADIIIQTGTNAPSIVRHYAQALIEQNLLSASIRVLKQLETQCIECSDTNELSETRGLLGRAHKQIYINGCVVGTTGDAINKSLQTAFQYYADEYKSDKRKSWHGVNALALWHRAQRDGIVLPSFAAEDEARFMLSAIQKEITNSGDEADMWTQASAAELCIALGDFKQALKWVGDYVDQEHVLERNSDAFEVGSTLRQFKELWQFETQNEQHARILQVLRSALLKRRGGSVNIQDLTSESQTIDQILNDTTYEQILGRERFKNLEWLQTGLTRARCVCKILDQFGDGVGTGFLIDPEVLNLPISAKCVVLTNAHVISSDSIEQSSTPAALPPEKTHICFEASDDPDRRFNIKRILASSPRTELDFAVLELDAEVTFSYEPIRHTKRLPAIDENQRIYVIGHPRGGRISFSLYDNLLLDHDIPKLHYRSPTQGGSSGSPVFNQNWDLIGLHHAGGTKIAKLNEQPGHYAANEGIWIDSIAAMISRINE